jgi:hypothetical protein
MAWRLAKSLIKLREQINTRWPDRSRVSDGAVGDLAHQNRVSDHNPGPDGVVEAIDITKDVKNGPDLMRLLPMLLLDKRVKYVIYLAKLYKPDGSVQKNKGHDKHLHVSVNHHNMDDTSEWMLAPAGSAPQPPVKSVPTVPAPPKKPTGLATLKRGMKGKLVLSLQLKLKEHGLDAGKADSVFGKQTAAAVKQFQKAHGLKVDQIVGPVTWAELSKPVAKPAAPGDYKKMLTKPENAVKFMEELGWSRYQAVALVANLLWESGGNKKWILDYAAHGDNDNSHGAGQWNEKHGRYDALLNYAREKNKPWDDPETQLRFLDSELWTTEKKAGQELLKTETLEDAVNAAITAWRPGIPHADKRLAIAKKLYGG